jgi:hypothetical protein
MNTPKGERNVDKPWVACLLIQQGLTAGASAFNALYFLRYSSRLHRRRWGSLALALVNLALLLQGFYLGLFPYLASPDADLVPGVRARCIVGLLPLVASLLIAAFILKRRRRRR